MSDIKLTMKKGLGAGAGSTSNVTSNKKSSTEKQTALIYDMLFEGPLLIIAHQIQRSIQTLT